MLQIDLWKRVLIILTCVTGLYLALPNAFYGPVEQHNDALKAMDLAGSNPELEAQAALWPQFLPERLVSLGLDLEKLDQAPAAPHPRSACRKEQLLPRLEMRPP